MQVPTDAITQVLGIQGFHVTELTVLECAVHLRIEPDRREHVCPHCKQELLFAYDVDDRTVRDLPMCGREVHLTFPQCRVLCPCSARVVTEHVDFVEPHQHQTRRLQEAIYWWLRTGTTTSKAAKAFGLSWHQVRHIDARMIRQEQGRQSWVGLRRIGVDEKAVGRGHDYITIVS
jgi:transposase